MRWDWRVFRLLWYCQLSCCASDFLSSSDISLYFLRECLIQHLTSSICTLCTFQSCFETVLDPGAAGVRVLLCSLSRSDRIVTKASCSGTEGLNVCSGDSLPLCSSSLKRHWWWWQRAQFVSMACPESILHQQLSTGLRSRC